MFINVLINNEWFKHNLHICFTNLKVVFKGLLKKNLEWLFLAIYIYKIGLPYNQLAILDVGRCFGLNSMYHYLLCLTSKIPFEGAKRNLFTALIKNESRFRKVRNLDYRHSATFK